jgi:pimeloyl-ACP methyl ester carboxylesterase
VINNRQNQTLSLRDNRLLAYAEYGLTHGSPLIYFHGTPGSRRECPFDLTTLQKLNIRLITTDRPGYGLSDYQQSRNLLDWPDDVVQLADALQLDQFSVLGFSGGGPYALACARQLGPRLCATGLVGCIAPFNAPEITQLISSDLRDMYALATSDPALLVQQLAPMVRSPEAVLTTLEEPAPAMDQAHFADPAFRNMYLTNLTEAFRQGAKGFVGDMNVAARPWGFVPANIEQPVMLWHGSEDRNVDVAMGHYLAQTLPHCTACFIEGEGHFSILKHTEVMLKKLMVG